MLKPSSQRSQSVSARRTQGGFSLIEILISILILLFGLLGMAGLQMRATQAEFESYQRKQALLLLQDMIDRVQANRAVGTCYTVTSATTGAPYFGNATTNGVQSAQVSPCAPGGSGQNTGTLDQRNTAIADLTQWNDALFGASEKTSGGTTSVGAMEGARGCITDLANGVVSVSIAWQGNAPTGAPPAALTCGTGRYGDESLRRVVSATLRLATLN